MKAPKFMEKLIESPFAKKHSKTKNRVKRASERAYSKVKGTANDIFSTDKAYLGKASEVNKSENAISLSKTRIEKLMLEAKSIVGLDLSSRVKRKVLGKLMENDKFAKAHPLKQNKDFKKALNAVARGRKGVAAIAGSASIGGAGYGMMSDSDGDE